MTDSGLDEALRVLDVPAKGDFLGQRNLFNTQYPQVIKMEV